MTSNGLNHALIEAIHECESADTEGNSWTVDEQDAAWTVARFLLALPVDRRMDAMGMVDTEWSCHPTPDGRRFMRFHDKNSVHMDGCRRLYVAAVPTESEPVVYSDDWDDASDRLGAESAS